MIDECQIIERLNFLQQLINGINKIFKTPVQGFSVTIPASVHCITKGIRGYLLLDPQGNSITVAFRVLQDNTVVINSNINLTGDILYLY